MCKKLFQAIVKNKIEVIRYILDKKANQDKTNSKGFNKIDVNYRDEITGNTALHLAIICDNMNAADILLDHGSDLNIKNNHGLSPMELYEVINFSWGRNINFKTG